MPLIVPLPKKKSANPVLNWIDDAFARIGNAVATVRDNAINRAGEIAYDATEGVRIYMGRKEKFIAGKREREKGYPDYMNDRNPDVWDMGRNLTLLEMYDPKTLPRKMPKLDTYRADPTGRFGGKDGLETLPTKFAQDIDGLDAFSGGGYPTELYAGARGMAYAKKYGVPQLSAEQLAAMALKEGRSDYGQLFIDYNNQRDLDLKTRLIKDGMDDHTAGFVVNIRSKMEMAKRLGITFEEAWNGRGVNEYGQSGREYSRNMEFHKKAAQHPKNKALVAFIQSALDAEKKK